MVRSLSVTVKALSGEDACPVRVQMKLGPRKDVGAVIVRIIGLSLLSVS
jgi:hypothetical protein